MFEYDELIDKAKSAILEKNMHKNLFKHRFFEKGNTPFIVAEMSGNHNQSLEKALDIVAAAAKSGCHGLKIQTYTADTMTIDCKSDLFCINDKNSLWNGFSLHKLYQIACTPWEWHAPIFKRCKALGLVGFSTPFDETAVDFLESIDTPIYKISSFENTDSQLIDKVASTGKPMIISTGMATVSELDETVRVAKESGCKDLTLLKCTSSYPSPPDESNLLTIPHLKQMFDVTVGLSDHTLGIGIAIASIALGAQVIEKHFTLNRAEGGVDAPFSLEPNEMQLLVDECKKAYKALGRINYGPTNNEKDSLVFRRSIFAVSDIKKGEIFSERNIRCIRPGQGLPPKYFKIIVGKKASQDIERGTPINWNYF